MDKLTRALTNLLNYTIVICLTLMATFVFINVILRYFFHSGITWSEEVSRFMFIWLIFLGAILGLKDNEHLGVDSLIKYLSVKNRKILFVINSVIIFVMLLMVADGTWKLTLLNTDQSSPAIGLPYAYVYVSGFIMSIAMAGIIGCRLYRFVTGKVPETELLMTVESEELAKLERDNRQTGEGGGKA